MTALTLEADAAARERIRTSLDESLVVEAAAGTGKTTVLVERMVAVLAEGRSTIDRLVAVTFTRKAAGELKLRLRQALDDALRAARRQDDAERRARLADAIARLEEAQIGTIHSFCAELLRRRPVEAGVDPAFVEMDQDEADRLYERAFRAWIERRLDELPPGLSRALRRLAAQRSFDGSTPVDRLRRAGRDLVDWRDFERDWRREDDFDRADLCQRLVEAARELEMLRRRADPRDPLARALEPLESLVTWVERVEEVTQSLDLDELEALLVETLRDLRRDRRGRTGRTADFVPGVARRDVVARRDALLEDLESFDRRAGADLAALLRAELAEVLDSYETLKRAAGRLDFLDLLVKSRDLLRQRPDVLAELRSSFERIFVDEFQDTDPLQAEVLLRLASENDPDDWLDARPAPGKLFLVGDPKQSIYRFRRADGVLYATIRERLEKAGAGVVRLGRSFRSVEPLQHATNATFARHMTGDTRSGQPEYVPLLGDLASPADQPALVALPAPAPYGYRYISGKAIDESLPDAVGAWVDWLVTKSRWTVRDPESPGGPDSRVPIEPRHVCLLFRRQISWGRDVTAGYRRALEARGVPHMLVGGRSFHQREEVETLRAALTALEWPDDPLAVYATLRGELFAFTDDALFHFLRVVGHLDPFRPTLDPDDLPESVDARLFEEIAEALAFLADLHGSRNAVPIATTIHRLLEHTRAPAGFAFRPAGDQVLGNVRRIAEMARAFEVGGGLSFRGFVERLDEAAEDPSPSHGPLVEEGAEGVRLMTVHSAKGLEFPVVVLVDPTCNATTREPSLHLDAEKELSARKLLGCSPWELLENQDLELDRDQAEAVRLAYVAATRARDLLVVTGVGTGPREGGWLGALDDAVYPPKERFADARPAPGCPPFRGSTVLRGPANPQDADPAIRPGLHRPRTGDHAVVWWDPAALELETRGPAGVRDHRLLAPDEEGRAVEDGLDHYLDWRDERAATVEEGARRGREVVAVTETEREPPAAVEVAVEILPRAADRPSGRRFGTLVHAMLRDAPAGPVDRDLLVGLARLHGRALSANDAERDAAVDAVEAALAHPLLVRAAELARDEPSRVLREWPFALELDGGFRLEGVFDLAILESNEEGVESWTVIDFKTGVDLEASEEAYRRQVAWYAHALEALDGRSARSVLLGV